MPIILAIETSSELASCALLSGGAVIARESSGVRTHSQSILPMVQELLAQAGVKLADCDAIAFGAGPGSFTGVRTACGIAQGLAFGADLPVVPLVTLEVYWAQYRYADGWQVMAAPALCAPGAVAPLPAERLAACGNGFAEYAEAFAERPFASAALTDIVPHARELAQLAALAFARGEAVPAAQAQPLYLRNKVAYTSSERQAINAAKAAA
jgi:tRNA threonylcarbamoyladenosine biosynthesis protein TsaB